MKRMAYLYRFNTVTQDISWTYDPVEVPADADLHDTVALAGLFYKYFGLASETWKMFAFDASAGDCDDGFEIFTDEYIDSWLRRGVWAPCDSFREGRISGQTVREVLQSACRTSRCIRR